MRRIALVFVSCSLIFACKPSAEEQSLEEARQKTIDSMKVEMAAQEARQKAIDSMNAVAAQQTKTVVVNNQAPAQTQEKKGWSGAAKGAVIGAGVGAITGAAVSKKKGEGAIIGGLAGAGVGAGTGAIIDSEKKRKAAQGK